MSFFRNLRQLRPLLQNTGGFEPLLKANNIADHMHELDLYKLLTAAEGKVSYQKDVKTLFDRLAGGALGVKKVEEALSKIIEKGDFDDKLKMLMLDPLNGEAMVNASRARRGLQPLDIMDAYGDAEAMKIALRFEDLLHEMGLTAVRHGYLTPERLLKNYIPALRRMKDDQLLESMDKAVASFRASLKPDHREDLAPFFSMARSGEVDLDSLSVYELIKSYSKHLHN